MLVFFSKYKNIIAFVCLCAASLILSWWTATKESYNNSLEHRLSSFLAPIHFCSSVISVISARVVYLGSIFVSIWQKPVEKAQLEDLKNEVENLKYQLDMEEARSRRLEELYEVYKNIQAELKPDRTFRVITAKVIAVEPTDWFRYVTIDKGKGDGVDVDMAVITRSDFEALGGENPLTLEPQSSDSVEPKSEAQGREAKARSTGDTPHLTGAVVGKIVDAQWHSAKVQLITDRLSVVAATIEDLGDLLLLRGRPETENCVIDEIPSTKHDRLKKGDAVIVDERSSIFPPRMLVGRISSIKSGIRFCPIEVQPAFKFSKLREVMVVLETGY